MHTVITELPLDDISPRERRVDLDNFQALRTERISGSGSDRERYVYFSGLEKPVRLIEWLDYKGCNTIDVMRQAGVFLVRFREYAWLGQLYVRPDAIARIGRAFIRRKGRRTILHMTDGKKIGVAASIKAVRRMKEEQMREHARATAFIGKIMRPAPQVR